tara:strand:- start:5547 stop:6047 length:501 start_codon:yes stop_codon:yes gene_type:complete
MEYTGETSKSKIIDYNSEGRYNQEMDYRVLHSAKIEDRAVKALVKYNKQQIHGKEMTKKLKPVVVRTRNKAIDLSAVPEGINQRYEEKLVSYNNRHYMLYDTENINSEDGDYEFIIQDYTKNTAKQVPFTEAFTYKNLDETIGVSKILNKDVITNSGRLSRTNKTL